MANYERITETRNLEAIRYLDLCDSTNWVDLVISSGEHEELIITGPANLVPRIQTKVENETLIIRLEGNLVDKIRDALTTSLSRKKITYHLVVEQLEGVELCGLIRLDTSGLKSGNPVIRHLNPWAVPLQGPIPFKKITR
jgi:hypothetical protein